MKKGILLWSSILTAFLLVSPVLAVKEICAKALEDYQCVDGACYHFVITQVGDNPPPFITVTFENGRVVGVPLQKVTGGTAHYEVCLNGAFVRVVSACTTISEDWTGEFNLSSGPCPIPNPTPTDTLTPLPSPTFTSTWTPSPTPPPETPSPTPT
ncbi:MAG: hypothetical protein ACPLKP_00070, partial [Microgenomates group bacterium]